MVYIIGITIGVLLTFADYASYKHMNFIYWLCYVLTVLIMYYGNTQYNKWKNRSKFWFFAGAVEHNHYGAMLKQIAEYEALLDKSNLKDSAEYKELKRNTRYWIKQHEEERNNLIEPM